MFYAVIHATVFFGSRIITLQWTLGIPHPFPLNKLGLTSLCAKNILYLRGDESMWWLNYTENVVDHQRATCNETFCVLLWFEEQWSDEMWIYLRVTASCHCVFISNRSKLDGHLSPLTCCVPKWRYKCDAMRWWKQHSTFMYQFQAFLQNSWTALTKKINKAQWSSFFFCI